MLWQNVPLPSVESLAFRANLASLVAPLRRVRPRVPFFKLAAHRIPTLWSLYRGLLKESPTDQIKFRIVMLFQRNRLSTGTAKTKKQLLQGYKWLDIFQRARQGDVKLQLILQRYSRMIQAKREKEEWKRLFREELAWQEKLRNRPILTGAYMRPHASHGPLPRMRRQPLALTMMIKKRRLAKDRRVEKEGYINELRLYVRQEANFEDELAKIPESEFTPLFSGANQRDWDQPLRDTKKIITGQYRLEEQRIAQPFPPALLETIKQARREKIANKTKELERERKGEILKRTILRQNKGPPAHLLKTMSPEQRTLDKVVRNVSEVGYVAQVKTKLGFKLKNPDLWKQLENGKEENQSLLERMTQELAAENRRRRIIHNKQVEDDVP